jgi:hypothetical protein
VPSRTALPFLLGLSFALAAPAAMAAPQPTCPEGKVSTRGGCFDPCPTSGPFAQPDACECPAGYGKILLGGGGGECRPLACPTGVAFTPGNCTCPVHYELKKLKKGQARCELVKAPAAAAKPAETAGKPAQ